MAETGAPWELSVVGSTGAGTLSTVGLSVAVWPDDDLDEAPVEPLEQARPFAADGSRVLAARSSTTLWRSGTRELVSDAGALLLSAMVAAVVVHTAHSGTAAFGLRATVTRLLPTIPVLVGLLATTRRHRTSLGATLGRQFVAVMPVLAIGGFVCLSGWRLLNVLGAPWPPPTDSLVITCLAGVGTVSVIRFLVASPPWAEARRRVLVVGTGQVADRVAEQLRSTAGVEVVGFVDDHPVDATACMGTLGELAEICRRHDVSNVVVAFSRAPETEILDAMRDVQGHVPITVVPRLFDVLPSFAALENLGSGLTGISVLPATLGSLPRALKRALDVVGAGGALLLASPLLLATAVSVKATSPGPVLFRQMRTGRDGRIFQMTKFRSMRFHCPSSDPSALGGQVAVGPFPKLKDDPRVTSVGRLIRRTSLDELPQLWHVLRGQMSLVGPRPFVPEEASAITGWAGSRADVRPGLTGLWQVSGRNDLTFEEMCRLDRMYVANWSIGLDLRILGQTLRAVCARRGAY